MASRAFAQTGKCSGISRERPPAQGLDTPFLPPLRRRLAVLLEDTVLHAAAVLRGPPELSQRAYVACGISNEEPTAERSFTVTLQTS